MTDKQDLPPLPEPIGEIVGRRLTPPNTPEFFGYFADGYKTDTKERVYSEAQLREFALEAIRSHEAERGARGWKFLKDTTHEERSWPEDRSHENGFYSNCCADCGRMFTGHKRRVVCRSCAAAPIPEPAAYGSIAERAQRGLDAGQWASNPVQAEAPSVIDGRDHYFNLEPGQRVRVHTGEEGVIQSRSPRSRYHVLMRPGYGGQYGAWEVTPVATPPTASPVGEQPDLSQWEKARFGYFDKATGAFIESATVEDDDKLPRDANPRWVGGLHDMQLLRAALATQPQEVQKPEIPEAVQCLECSEGFVLGSRAWLACVHCHGSGRTDVFGDYVPGTRRKKTPVAQPEQVAQDNPFQEDPFTQGYSLGLAHNASQHGDDTELLDWLKSECCDLRCIGVPTGGDDHDVRWVVIEHHMASPQEREIGESFTDDPRDAIRAARTRGEGA